MKIVHLLFLIELFFSFIVKIKMKKIQTKKLMIKITTQIKIKIQIKMKMKMANGQELNHCHGLTHRMLTGTKFCARIMKISMIIIARRMVIYGIVLRIGMFTIHHVLIILMI